MSKLSKAFWKWMGPSWFSKKNVSQLIGPAYHSTYALMPNGGMRSGSIGYELYHKLLEAYHKKYKDAPDKDTLIASISSNYENETTQAWHAFLAEIGEDE